MKPRGSYIGWVGKDNLGDEALFEVCRERFPDVAWQVHLPDGPTPFPSPARFVRSTGSARHLADALMHELRHWTRTKRMAEAARERSQTALATVPTAMRRRFAGERGILGGGTLINHATFLRAYLRTRERVGRPIPIFGCGVADPTFWPGRRDGWVDQRSQWREALAELPLVGVRGPRSRDMLRDAGLHQAEMVGDAAVLLHTPEVTPSPSRTFGTAPVIGVNCGCNSGALWGTYDELMPRMVETVRRLLARGYRVELVAVWPEDRPACEDVYNRLKDVGDVVIAPVFTSHDTFLTRVRRYDAFIAIKLHAGVLAAAANVPFVMLEYRPKCLDFSMSIDWADYTVRTSEMQPDQVEELVERQLATADATRVRLAASMGKLRRDFVDYTDRIAPLLV